MLVLRETRLLELEAVVQLAPIGVELHLVESLLHLKGALRLLDPFSLLLHVKHSLRDKSNPNLIITVSFWATCLLDTAAPYCPAR